MKLEVDTILSRLTQCKKVLERMQKRKLSDIIEWHFRSKQKNCMFLLSHVKDRSFDNTTGMSMPSDNHVTCLYVKELENGSDHGSEAVARL